MWRSFTTSRTEFDAARPALAQLVLRALGLHAVMVAPLPGAAGPLGVLVLGWDRPRPVSLAETVTVTTIAGYAAQALARARYLHSPIICPREPPAAG